MKRYILYYNLFRDAVSDYTEEPRKTLLNDAGPRGGRNFFSIICCSFFTPSKTLLFDIVLIVRLMLQCFSFPLFSAWTTWTSKLRYVMVLCGVTSGSNIEDADLRD